MECGAVVYIEIVRTVQKIQVEKETVRTDLSFELFVIFYSLSSTFSEE